MYVLLILLGIIIFSFLLNKPGQRAILIKRDKRHKRNDRNRIKDLDFTKEDRKIIFKKFDNKCFNCGSKKKLTIDHHYPLEKGYGLKNSDGSYNAVLLCSKCNMKKSNKMPENFYTPLQIEILEEVHKLKKIQKEVYDIYNLKDERALIDFEYLGKKYRGNIENILEEEIKLMGVRNKIYIEISIEEENLIFPLNGIKNLQKIRT